LSHMSVKEYLLSQHLYVGGYGFNIDEKLSHSLIGQTCLAYLLQFNTVDMLTPKTIKDYPLSEYAAQYWIVHVRSGSRECADAQQRLMMAIFQPMHTPSLISWVRLSGVDIRIQNLSRPSGDIPQAIYYASLLGLLSVVQALIEKGASIDGQGGFYDNALQAASCCGHEDIVCLLLDKGADINAQGGFYGNALQAASYSGHGAIVCLLLDKGADINAQGGYYGNALQAASCSGSEAIVCLLLDKGADINAQGGCYGNALQAASYHDHEAVWCLLLEKGADINTQGGDYGNALQTTSYSGYGSIVCLCQICARQMSRGQTSRLSE
jgi:Ankyrin repeats (3 copies)